MTGEIHTTTGVVRMSGDHSLFVTASPPATDYEMTIMNLSGVVTQSEVETVQQISEAEPPYSLMKVDQDPGLRRAINDNYVEHAHQKARQVAICLAELRGQNEYDVRPYSRDIDDLNVYPFGPVRHKTNN